MESIFQAVRWLFENPTALLVVGLWVLAGWHHDAEMKLIQKTMDKLDSRLDDLELKIDTLPLPSCNFPEPPDDYELEFPLIRR
jgi:hypothetical protein